MFGRKAHRPLARLEPGETLSEGFEQCVAEYVKRAMRAGRTEAHDHAVAVANRGQAVADDLRRAREEGVELHAE